MLSEPFSPLPPPPPTHTLYPHHNIPDLNHQGFLKVLRSWAGRTQKENTAKQHKNQMCSFCRDCQEPLLRFLQHAQVINEPRHFCRLKGNGHQILLSGMSLQGVEVPIEKQLLKILGRLKKGNTLNDDAKVPLYRASSV